MSAALPPGGQVGAADGCAREPSGLIGSAQRALRVLEVVAAAGDPLTAKAVARRAGFKLGTTYHLLNTLAHEGYLVRVGHGRGFRLGHKLGSLSAPSGVPAPAGRPAGRRCPACGSDPACRGAAPS